MGKVDKKIHDDNNKDQCSEGMREKQTTIEIETMRRSEGERQIDKGSIMYFSRRQWDLLLKRYDGR